ncbi:two-component regulator propeller domain-containing protein [Catalinimonas sp. 4WD22]|uniref:two-component regulator propeller domain-containing protein n=1 Tax=Catalinimonas locisalis TaxID=3133978 RepID=UPI003100F583
MYKLKPPKIKPHPPLYFILSLCFLFFSQYSTAQKPPVVFKNYTVLDGLSYNYVSEIYQDTEGIVWLGTPDGLNKFLGHDFKTYRSVVGDSTSLPSNFIISLVEDDEKNLWVGTWGGGICLYDRKTDNFKHPKLILPQQNDLGDINFISELYKDSEGNIWACTDRGLLKIKPSTLQAKLYTSQPINKDSISPAQFASIVEDKKGNFWVATYGNGLLYLDPVSEKFTSETRQNNDPSGITKYDISKLYYDSKDRLWIATFNEGIYLLEDNKPGNFKHFSHQPGDPTTLSNNQVISFTETMDGKIWVGTDNGLCQFNEEEENFYVYKKGLYDPKSLSGSEIKSLFTDHEGRLWVGTYNGGVNIFDDSYISTLHYYAIPGENTLSYDNVTAFLYLDDNTILIGTDGGGLNIFNPENGKFTSFLHDAANPKSIGGNKVKSLLQDSKGRVWVSFWNSGIDLFDPVTHTFKHYTHAMGPGNGPNNDNILSLAEDDEGMIWMTTLGGGLNSLDPKTESFEYFDEKIVSHDGVEDSRFVSLLIDSRNTIWIGSTLGNFFNFDKDTKTFSPQLIWEEGESKSQVQCIFEDSMGNLWLGLEGGGLKSFDRKSGKFKTFTINDGLPSNHVHAIEEDTKGQLWLSTNQGISCFTPEEQTFKNYDMRIGLQGLQFNRVASAHLPTGEMLFGGSNGFNMFHPDSLNETIRQIPIVFTDFQIFNKPVSIGQENSPLQTHINVTDTITLRYDQSVFSIEYAGLDYTFPDKVSYQYKLKGFVDESWQKVGNERKATYTNLDPGEYEFIVTTISPDNTHSRKLTIIVTPPWWKTWWARSLFFLLFAGLIYAGYYLRLRRISSQKKKLESEVAVRTKKLQSTNHALQEANKALHEKNLLIQEQKEEIQTQAEELAESNEEVKSINQQLEERVEIRTADLRKSNQELDNFVYRVSHDIRAPLSSILGLVELIEDENDKQQLKEYLKMTSKSIHKLDSFVKDILDYSRNSRMQIEREQVSFPELLKEVREELQYMENSSRLHIHETYHLEGEHYSDIRRLQIIFRNLLSNAIKYLNPRNADNYLQININVTKDKAAGIILEDNGIGISATALSKVFEMFYRGSDLSTGSGIGLYIVKETVEKLGGTIELQSELGVGTKIMINLPAVETEQAMEKKVV